MNKLSIIIPVYYNSETLEALYDDLQKEVLAMDEQAFYKVTYGL